MRQFAFRFLRPPAALGQRARLSSRSPLLGSHVVVKTRTLGAEGKGPKLLAGAFCAALAALCWFWDTLRFKATLATPWHPAGSLTGPPLPPSSDSIGPTVKRFVDQTTDPAGCFLVVAGPPSSGKTTAIATALCERTAVVCVAAVVDNDVRIDDLVRIVSRGALGTEARDLHALQRGVRAADSHCRRWVGRPLVLSITLAVPSVASASFDDVRAVAAKVAAVAAAIADGHSAPRVLLEVNNPALTRAMTTCSSCARVVHTRPPPLSEFTLMAVDAVSRDPFAPQAFGAPPTASDLEITTVSGGATLAELAEDFYYRVSPDCRQFARLVSQAAAGPAVHLRARALIDAAHAECRTGVQPGDEALLTELAEAGPLGLPLARCSDPGGLVALLRRDPAEYLVRPEGPAAVLDSHGLAHLLLKAKYRTDDGGARAIMRDRGWGSLQLPEQRPAAAARKPTYLDHLNSPLLPLGAP
ncbi:hypothetical protein DIPPA_04557 [Diplonema papillatum]|nr:hypothetical protein DIPPA_04557 [Diplonema papillatum]